MLVLSRKVGEHIRLGDSIEVLVVSTSNGRVRLGIQAPKEVLIRRSELEGVPPAQCCGDHTQCTEHTPIGQEAKN